MFNLKEIDLFDHYYLKSGYDSFLPYFCLVLWIYDMKILLGFGSGVMLIWFLYFSVNLLLINDKTANGHVSRR